MKPGTKPRPKHIVTPAPGAPPAPRYLNKVARVHWYELVPLLDSTGTLSRIDRDALAAMCTLFARWRDAEDHLEEEGCVVDGRKSAWVAIATETLSTLRVYQVHFGLTPKARQGQVQPLSPEIEDKWTQLLTG